MGRMLGHGVYALAEVAAFTQLRPGRLRGWIKDHPFLNTDYDVVEGDFALSFLDMIEILVAGQMREHDVPLQRIRQAYEMLQSRFGVRHPFAHEDFRFLTDGRDLFLSEKDGASILDINLRQQVFPVVLRPFLRQLDYDDETKLAARWNIDRNIVLDPARSFGKPLVAATGHRTDVLAAALRANGDNADLVADWFGVSPGDVMDAAAFEEKYAR